MNKFPQAVFTEIIHLYVCIYSVSFLAFNGLLLCWQVPGFPAWYNVVYDDTNDEDVPVYTYKLKGDMESGDVEVLINTLT